MFDQQPGRLGSEAPVLGYLLALYNARRRHFRISQISPPPGGVA